MYVKDMKKIVTGMVTDVDNDSSTATIAAADTIAFNDVSVEGNVMKRITYSRFKENLIDEFPDTESYTSTVTAAGVTALTAASTNQQFFTGTTTQTVTLPTTATFTLGDYFLFTNNSTGIVTVNTFSGDRGISLLAGMSAKVTCISIAFDTLAGWDISSITKGTNTGDETLATLGLAVTGAAGKTPPVAADTFVIGDSTAGGAVNKITYTNLVTSISNSLTVVENPSVLALDVDGTLVIPAGYFLDGFVIKNVNGNAITGGLNIGTTAGGKDVLLTEAVGGNAEIYATSLIKWFAGVSPTTLYITDETAWNGAVIDVYAVCRKVRVI